MVFNLLFRRRFPPFTSALLVLARLLIHLVYSKTSQRLVGCATFQENRYNSVNEVLKADYTECFNQYRIETWAKFYLFSLTL